MANSKGKVHPSVRDLNIYGGYEINPIGSREKAPVTNQNPSTKDLNRPKKAQWGGNEISHDRSHIEGPQSANRFNTPAPQGKF